jgi:hypothetical protein
LTFLQAHRINSDLANDKAVEAGEAGEAGINSL